MASELNDVPESPEDRMLRRRARRWKRRARMAGPFLGIPLLLGTLTLSVDLIEYDPQPTPDRLSDRPIPVAVLEGSEERRADSSASVSSTSVVSAAPTGEKSELDVTLAGDTPLVGGPQFRAPIQNYALPRAR